MELKKVQKQGRDERTQKDYPTSAVCLCRCTCRVFFLRSFISVLFLYFFQLHPYLKSSFTGTFLPSALTNDPCIDKRSICILSCLIKVRMYTCLHQGRIKTYLLAFALILSCSLREASRRSIPMLKTLRGKRNRTTVLFAVVILGVISMILYPTRNHLSTQQW